MTTNITDKHCRAFEALTSGLYDNFASYCQKLCIGLIMRRRDPGVLHLRI